MECMSSGLQSRARFAVLDIVKPLLFNLLRLRLTKTPTEIGAASIAVEVQSSFARTIDVTCRFVRFLFAMSAAVFHVLTTRYREASAARARSRADPNVCGSAYAICNSFLRYRSL